MCEYKWSRSRYKLFISRWGIAIILEAGYKILSATENREDYIKIVENLYASFDLIPYSGSQQLIAEEQILFCNGLKLVSGQILEALQGRCCLITLRRIEFSPCDIQDEAYTACAIQWASEAFGFPMPAVNVWFDREQPPCGRYVFDFSPADGV